MLYHKLLSNLLASPTESEDALDFQVLWTRMGLAHDRKFSKKFVETAGLALPEGSTFAITCLDDLTEAWRNAVEALYVDGIDDTLKVVYRSQGPKRKGKRKQRTSTLENVLLKEQADIVSAVMASLPDAKLATPVDRELVETNFKAMLGEVGSGSDTGDATAPDTTLEATTDSGDDAALQWAIQQSLLEQVRQRPEVKNLLATGGIVDSEPASPSKGKSPDSGEDTEPDDTPTASAESTIIGTKTFQMNERFLNTSVNNVLDWWLGRRSPKGVALHLTRRCS